MTDGIRFGPSITPIPDRVRQPADAGERGARKKRNPADSDDESAAHDREQERERERERTGPKDKARAGVPQVERKPATSPGEPADAAFDDEEHGRHIDTRV